MRSARGAGDGHAHHGQHPHRGLERAPGSEPITDSDRLAAT
jgi:hypothetical protein